MTKVILREWNFGTSAPNGLHLIRDVEYGRVGNYSLLLHILCPASRPEMPAPVLIGIHGGGWAGGSKDWCLDTLLHFAQRGYFCAAVGHRFQGEAPFPSMIEDCKCAVRYLRAHAGTYQIDRSSHWRLGLFLRWTSGSIAWNIFQCEFTGRRGRLG